MSGNTSASGGYLIPTSDPIVEDDALVDIFTAAIGGMTGIPGAYVRPAFQVQPPARPDATVDWVSVRITEQPDDAGPVIQHDPAGDGVDVVTRHEDITVLTSFYGPNAKGNAKLLAAGLSVPQNLEALQLNSITFVSAGKIIAAPESVNMQWLYRYDLLLYFRRMNVRTYQVQNIETAGVELHVDDYVTNISVE